MRFTKRKRKLIPETRWSITKAVIVFDEQLTFFDQTTAVSRACNYHTCKLRCVRPYVDSSTACAIATSRPIVHSKLDYCYSHYYKLPKSQLSRLQQIQNSLARTVMKAHKTLKLLSPKSCHITLILRSSNNYVGDLNGCAKLGAYPSTGSFWSHGWSIIKIIIIYTLFGDSPTG